jgi:tetratricopeptide (TPR) repeat protein
MADRYTYVPLTGLFIILAWGVPEVLKGIRGYKVWVSTAALPTLAVLSPLTWVQIRYWQNGEVLFRHALEVTDRNYFAHNGLALSILGQDPAQSVEHFRRSIAIRPDNKFIYSNIAIALAEQKKEQEAISFLKGFIKSYPKDAEVKNTLGILYLRLEQFKQAGEQFKKAIKLMPEHKFAHANLGFVLLKLHNPAGAEREYREAIGIRSAHPAANHNGLAMALALQEKWEEALLHFDTALRLRPKYAAAYYNKAMLYQTRGDKERAEQHFRKASALDPSLGDPTKKDKNLS